MADPKFIQSKKPSCRIGRDWHDNDPVNIRLCQSLIKLEQSLYYGGTIFKIYFKGCDTTWHFTEQHERDQEFERILNEYSGETTYEGN